MMRYLSPAGDYSCWWKPRWYYHPEIGAVIVRRWITALENDANNLELWVDSPAIRAVLEVGIEAAYARTASR